MMPDVTKDADGLPLKTTWSAHLNDDSGATMTAAMVMSNMNLKYQSHNAISIAYTYPYGGFDRSGDVTFQRSAH